MKRKIAIAGAAITALLMALVFSAAGSSQVSASKGPTKSGVTTVNFTAEDLKLATVHQDSRMLDYPDGAHMFQDTFYWENNPNSTWDVNSYSVWNVPFSSGGHTDTLTNSCKFLYVSDNQCTGGAGDGGTRVDFGQDNLSDSQTFYTRTWMSYGGTTYCRMIYLNNSGDTAWGYCP